MRNCPLCHTENRPAANFCRRCGAVLATHCPRCATELPEAALFCDHCGVRLLEPAEDLWGPGSDDQTGPRQARPAQTTEPPAMAEPSSLESPAQASSPPPPASQPSAKRTALQQFVPPELMARLEAAARHGGMVGERRIVTILFCDTVGSTAAAEQLDPEEWTEIINGAFEQMIRPIYHYEGTVARLMGDGLLAFFGAPIAHEDDPQRAVLAGLEIIEAVAAYARQVQARWGLPLDVRVGINTGKVVVGSVGSDLRMEYTAIGDAINVAARMEQTAGPGTVQVAQETYRFVEPFFECEPLGAIDLKGKETPVQAYRVLRARSQPARRRGPAGLQAPLLGREMELARLRQAAQRAAQGVGQIALLVGEAGLGKSRLLDELHREQTGGDADKRTLRWVQATGAAHEAGEPFALLRGLLRGLVVAGSDAAPGDLRHNLLALTAQTHRAELAAVLDVLLGKEKDGVSADSLRAPSEDRSRPSLSGEGFRRHLAAAITALLRDVAREGPLVLALDDLHWADAASVDLLLQLLPLTDALPLFFLFAMRPERQTPGWQLRQEAEANHAHRVTVVNVRPLAPEDSERLVGSLLSDGRLPAQVRQLVLEKAEGNPFFVEEVIRSLLDRGLVEAAGDELRWRGDGATEDIAIPDSLQSLLTARIDRLREETRYTLQLASVIGRSFTYRVLQEVSDLGEALQEQLDVLQQRTVIHEAARLPELEYAFHHALMQEAAYRSILLRQRRAFHLRVAQAMEQLFADRLEAFALPLARHFYEAGDARALGYFRLAGDAAMRVFANVEAAEHYGLAIQCARQQPESAAEVDLLTLYQRRGRALELTSRYEEALRNYQDLMALSQAREAQGLESQAMRLAALVGQARQRVTANQVTDYEQGRVLLEEALPLAQALQDREAEATIMWLQVLLLMFRGDHEQQMAFGERGLALARKLGLQELEAFILHDMWYVYGSLGRWQEMNDALRQACDLWQALDNVPMLAASLTRMHFAQAAAGQYEQALQTSQEAHDLGVQGRDLESQVLSRAVVGLIHLERGRPDLALASLDENLPLAQSIGNVTVLSTGPAYKAWVYAMLGDYGNAMTFARQGVDYALSYFPLIAAMPQAILVRILLLQGDLDQAQQAFSQMEDYAKTRRRVGFFAMSWLMSTIATGELALRQGEYERASAIAAEFVANAGSGDLHFLLPDAYLLQSRAQAALGQEQKARASLEEGLAQAEAQDSKRMLWPILAELAQSAAAEGNDAQARALRQRAVDVVQFIAAHIDGEEMRTSFMNQETVRSLLDH